MPVIVIIPSNVLFPDDPCDYDDLVHAVRSLSRTDALFWCARLNHFLAHPGDASLHARQSAIAQRFLSEEQQRLATAWAQRGNYSRDQVTMIFRSQLVQLAHWIALFSEEHENDGTTFEDPETRLTFVKAALIAGDLWNDAAYPAQCFNGATPSEMKRNAIVSLREGITAARHREPLHISLARGNAFYSSDFCDRFPTAESTFMAATGLTMHQYLSCAAMLVISREADGDTPSLDTSPMHSVADRSGLSQEASEALTKYLHCASQTADEFANALRTTYPQRPPKGTIFSLKRLREKPLLATSDGRVIAIDSQFAQDKLALGPLFEFPQPHRLRAFEAFGHAVEGYVQRLVKAATPDAGLLAERIRCNPKHKTSGKEHEFADIVWQLDGGCFGLLEVKASFLPETSIQPGDPETYIAQLRRKCSSPQNSDSRAIGTYQLARTVRAIGAGEIRLEESPRIEPTIYPILVLLDRELTNPGHPEVLGADFRDALELGAGSQLPTVRVGCVRVRPLVVATVADLEYLHMALERYSLKQILDEYIGWMIGGSLNDFLAINAKRFGIRESESLVDDALDSLERTRAFFFGEVTLPNSQLNLTDEAPAS